MKFPMLYLLFLISIVSVLAQGEDNCTLYKYATVNTFREEKSYSFSCYGIGTDCEVYYAPPGTGCTGDLVTLVGTLPENETQVLTSDKSFELGCMFCSNNQIGVSYVNETLGYVAAHLPRATEAATKFRLNFLIAEDGIVTQCVVSALSLHATVRVSVKGDMNTYTLEPYSYQQFKTPIIPGLSPSIITATVDSDTPVIVSCIGIDTEKFATLQPISSEPLILNSGDSDSVAMLISNCSTNARIQDSSKVNFVHLDESGSPCDLTPSDTGDPNVFRANSNCVFYLEPLEDVCVAMILLGASDGALVTMGIPESKLSTRFAKYPNVNNVNLISFFETACTGFSNPPPRREILNLDWVGDGLSGKVSYDKWMNPFFDFAWTECGNPVLLISRNDPKRIPFLSGYQSEDLWTPYFESICPVTPTKSPSSSDDRSLIIYWIGFFAVFIFECLFV